MTHNLSHIFRDTYDYRMLCPTTLEILHFIKQCFGAGEMIHLVKCLVYNLEDLSSHIYYPQHPHKKLGRAACTYNSSAGLGIRGSLLVCLAS